MLHSYVSVCMPVLNEPGQSIKLRLPIESVTYLDDDWVWDRSVQDAVHPTTLSRAHLEEFTIVSAS